MADAGELKVLLAAQAESVARSLLPNGKIEGRDLVVGSVGGEQGRSLKVCISGTRAGVWADFASGEGGDLLDLWVQVKGISLSDAMREAHNFLGINQAPPKFIKPKPQQQYVLPKRTNTTTNLSMNNEVVTYLTQERMLSPESVTAYRVAVDSGSKFVRMINDKLDTNWIVFPSLSKSGELTAIKYVHLDRPDGKKVTTVEAKCKPILFGWQALSQDSRSIVICEGEIDAITLHQYGWPAVSVPFGGGRGNKQQWIDHEYENLEQFDTIYLCLDMDEEGEIGTHEIASRLGVHRCHIVKLPHKDPNECLKNGVTAEQMATFFNEAKTVDPEELKRANAYIDDVMSEFYPPGGVVDGFESPWLDSRGRRFIFRRSEVSLWTGINGHGKSLGLGQVILSAINQGERAVIYSGEMPAKKTLHRLVRQASGKEKPSEAQIKECLDWMGNNLWLFNLVGTAKTNRLIEVFHYAYKRYGVRQFVIDSLMKCGMREDDYGKQKEFVEELMDFANQTGCHVHLVAHSRKKEDEMHRPGKMDVKGTGAITDLVDNFFCVWRNKTKEEHLKNLRTGIPLPKGVTEEVLAKAPDTIIYCEKCREDGDMEDRASMMFDLPSMQLTQKGLVFEFYKSAVKDELPTEWFS